MTFFRALGHRNFALLWSGQTVSRVGDFVYQLALTWWLLEKTGSPEIVGVVLSVSFAPMLFFLLIGGVTVDRYSRVKIMLASDLLRGLVVSGVALLAFQNTLEVWHVVLATLIFSFVDAFFQPAFNALVPQITPVADLPSANALASLSVQVGRVIGPAVGGLAFGITGAAWALAINAASFFISGALLLPLLSVPEPRAMPRHPTEKPHVWRDIREGLDTVIASPVLWVSIVMFAFTNITLAGPYSVSMPFLIDQRYDHDPVLLARFANPASVLGLLYALFPIGYILGGIYMGTLKRFRRRGVITTLSTAVAGLMLGLFGLPLPLVVLMVAALINGAALEMGTQVWTNLMQTLVPVEQMGRVSSFDALGSYVLLPVGFGLVGWATQHIGAPMVFILGGTLTVIVALLALAHPVMRRLD